jgi:hypothetical protein
MALQIEERSVVRDDFEAVPQRFETPPRAVTAVLAPTDEPGEGGGALVGA